MNLTPTQLQGALVIGLCLITIIATVFIRRKETPAELAADIREEVLMMFLYAEKQDWANEDKMKFVVHLFYEKFPAVVQAIIKETTVEEFLEKLYQDFKQYLIDGKIEDFNLKADAAAVVDPAKSAEQAAATTEK